MISLLSNNEHGCKLIAATAAKLQNNMFFYTSLAGALKLSLIFTINCTFHYFNVLVKVMVVGWNEILVTEFCKDRYFSGVIPGGLL